MYLLALQERLLQAMECSKGKLTVEEVQRNTTGSTLVTKYDSDMKPYNYPSSLVGKFHDIMKCQTRCEISGACLVLFPW